MKRTVTNLCMFYEPPRILLGLKKRGFGTGRWNGFGGKVDADEKMEDSARREVLEEVGIKIEEMHQVGYMEFEFPHKDEVIEVHVFKAEKYSGEPTETEEMRPEWFHVDKIPYTEMWPDDPFWIPLFLENKIFKGRCVYGPNDEILDNNIKEVENL